MASAWGGIPNAPQNFAAITAGYHWPVDNRLYILDNQNWYAHDGVNWVDSGTLSDAWNYTTSAECVGGVNDGNPCDPTVNNDCPGSHCIESGRYVPVNGQDWSVPDTVCSPEGRPDEKPGDYCAVPPKIDNINVNKTEIQNTDFVNLTFNSIVDSQQLPLVMYAVDWGDGDKTVVSGVEMRDRTNPDRPHSLYHLYSYWDLKAKEASGVTSINCSSGECKVQPKVKIKDNWGWCSNGSAGDQCPQGNSGWEPGVQINVNE